MRPKTFVLVTLPLAFALLLGACTGSGALTDALQGQITLLSGTAESNNAPPATGDFVTSQGGPPPRGEQATAATRWVGLKTGSTRGQGSDGGSDSPGRGGGVDTGSAAGLDPVVTNGTGLTLYRFDRDSANPPTSNCEGDCAETWPKVLVGEGGRLFADGGVEQSRLGSIPAGDGRFQLTLGGWPLYRFARDTRPGQANGQGVQGTWFAVAPDGEKARGNGESDSGGSDNDRGNGGDNNGRGNNGNGNGGGGGNTATAATLFDDPGRPGDGAAQGVSNSRADSEGCVDVPRPGRASSITASGSYTLYAGGGCTGRRQQLSGNQDDLGGFDDAVRSIRLARRD